MRLLRFGPQICGELDQAAQREWLVTDGRGGYAMGTVAGLRTRRYHGLLVVAGRIPGRRHLALAALDPVLTLPSGAAVRLGTHEWASGAVDPAGHALLESFDLVDGVPRWRWRIAEVVLERMVAMHPAYPGVAVVHRLLAGGPVTLRLDALCTWRDMHGERRAGDGLDVSGSADGVVVDGAYRVAGPSFTSGGEWYLGAHYREEEARGLLAEEDLCRVGHFAATLAAGDTVGVSAWAGDAAALAQVPPPAAEVLAAARQRATQIIARSGPDVGDAALLALAADAFVVRPHGGAPDIVAGYPWFGSWSRDTMIAYEGLLLATGRHEEGRELLLAHAATLSQGMLANTADTGSVAFNTADATLWFLHAVERHLHATGDTDLADNLVAQLDAVVRHHLEGTRFGLRVDPADGLLTQGAHGYALTWMDAVVGGVAVTPRAGKAVELNALWINGLAALAALRARLGRAHDDLDARRAQATGSFVRRFPAPAGWLYDVVDGPTGDDPALRPNQLLAFSLPYAPLRGGDPAPVRAAGQALLTPLGLRSLAPDDPAYRGRHRGDPAGRDGGYHQGTVWPWLLGPYVDAAAAVGLPREGLLTGIRAHLAEWGAGSVSETADGDPPHAATGCPFQAWSVAEAYRLLRQEG